MSQRTPSISNWMDRLRRPEYTGENRCTPCTVLNVAIASGLGALFSVLSIPLGVVAFAAGMVVIYLRGYLVPYTPAITKRYFPDRVLRWFDKHPATREASAERREDLDVERTLFDLGVVTPCADVDDLCLAPAFRESWHDHVEEFRETDVGTGDVARLLDIEDESDHEVVTRGTEAVVVLVDGTHVGQWESDAALLADLAADRALREWTDEWDRYHVLDRSELLNSLRMFLERCVECGDPVTVDRETVESCCRSFDVVAVTCDGCGSRFFEIELTDDLEAQL